MNTQNRETQIAAALQRARDYLSEGKKESAARLLRKICQVAPDNLSAWLLLAQSSADAAEVQNAIKRASDLELKKSKEGFTSPAGFSDLPNEDVITLKQLRGVHVQHRSPIRTGCGCIMQILALGLLIPIVLLMVWVAVGMTLRINQHQSLDSQPAWSPSGSRIAFASWRTNKASIWIMNADGSSPWPLLPSLSGASTHPTWSPDERWIAYLYNDEGQVGLWVAGVPQTPGGAADPPIRVWCCEPYSDEPDWMRLSSPTWSPDGKWLAFLAAGPGLYTDGRSFRDVWMLTAPTTEDGVAPELRNVTQSNRIDERIIRWAPDSRHITYDAIVFGSEPLIFLTTYTYELDTQTGEVRPLVEDTVQTGEDSPVWSPDGHWLAYSSRDTGNDDIMLMDAGRTQIRNLTGDLYWYDGAPTWSPDSSRLAFVSYGAGNFDIWSMDTDGRNRINLTAQTVEYRFPPIPWLPILGLIALIPLAVLVPSAFDWLRSRTRKKQ